MNGEERIFHKIIKEICAEKNIEFEKLSYDWIIQLKKNNQVYHITGNRFDINGEASSRIAGDKYATYEVLKSQNIPVIEHKMIFNPVSREEYITNNGMWSDIIKYFFDKNQKVVIKPNHGCEGIGVYLCDNLSSLEYAIHSLLKSNGSISMCPYYDIETEYRTFYLDGECELIYGKQKPSIIGDGISNISKLLEEQGGMLPDNSIVDDNLTKLDYEYIPEKGEKIYLSWKHNLSGGALPFMNIDDSLKNKIKELVLQTAKSMNINFASIDIIKTKSGELYVLEVNSGICMRHFIENIDGGYEISKSIYGKAIEKIFK